MKLLTELNEPIKETFNIKSIGYITHECEEIKKSLILLTPTNNNKKDYMTHTLHYIHEQVMSFSHSHNGLWH